MRILSYNTGLFRTDGRDRVPRVQQRYGRWVEFLKQAAEVYSIVALQEVYEAEHAREFARIVGEDFEVVWPGRGGPVCSGLWVAFPRQWSAAVRFVPFVHRHGEEQNLFNGLVRLDLPEFSLIATHLQAVTVDRGGRPTLPEQVAAFQGQVETVRAHLPARPALVVGDLNVGVGLGTDLFEALVRDWEVEPAEVGATWDPANPTIRDGEYGHDPKAQIDHILSRGLRPRRAWLVPQDLSDHHGIGAEF